jgi:magnesium transporter
MAVHSYYLLDNRIIELDYRNVTLESPLTWIWADNPTPDEIYGLSKIAELDIDVFEDCLDEAERSRIESDEYVLIVYRAPYYENEDIITIPLGFIIKKNIIITVCKKSVKSVDELSRMLSSGRGKFLFRQQLLGVLFNIIDKINEEYLGIINRVVDTSDIIEEKIFEINKENVHKILSINTTLAYFHSSLSANLEVIKILRKGYLKPFRNSEFIGFFDDLYYDVLELIDAENIQRDIINNLFDMQSTIVSNELNIVIKKITAIATIIMIPTLISGIYGMNFKYLPVADYINGFYIIISLMLFIVITLVLYFRRLKWI